MTRVRVVGSAFVLLLSAALSAQADVIYNSIPSPLPGNYPSLGYQATSTREAGDQIAFAGTARQLDTVTVGMSSWALFSTYANDPRYNTNQASFEHLLTLTLYNVDTTGPVPAAGSVIGSVTKNAAIPFRPESSTACTGGRWSDANGNCFSGLAFTVAFDFTSSGIVLPNQVIFGLSFNTQSYGASPIGLDGPYNSLNLGLPDAGPTVGTDVNPDAIFWNTGHAPFLTSGTAGVFSEDTTWTGYVPAVRVDASNVPEPSLLGLLGLGLIAAARRARRS